MSQRSEQEFRQLVEAAPDGIVISRNGVLLYVNPAAVALLGYDDASELLGRPMTTFLDEASIGTMRRRLEQLRESGAKLSPREYPATRRDGSKIIAEISSMLTEFEGAPAVLAFARDVTERTRLRALLVHADRLAALGIITAGVAHEINNPLTFMTLAAEMLTRRLRTGQDEESLAIVRDIVTGADRIAHIVRDLRLYARDEDEPAGPVDLASIIASAERIVAHEILPRARLERDIAELPPVLGVATRFEQVIVNLLLNAAFAIDERRTDGRIVLRARAAGDTVIVEVVDNGSGMGEELLSRIFEPFFTTRPTGSGTGLGLSICRDIVARSGGDLVAASEPGEGTTVRMTLPVTAFGRVAPADPPPTRTALPRRRVLVIDDEPLVVSMVSRLLGDRHDVTGETDARRGLASILGDATFDVVLCDLMMPGLTGMDLLGEVARARPGMERRLVFVTGGPYTSRMQDFLAKVPNRRLQKPFSVDELEDCLTPSPLERT